MPHKNHFVKKFINFLGIIFLIIVILSLALFFFIKNLKIKELVEKELERELGINVTIDKLDFSPLLAHIGASGITVYNPAGFQEEELAYISSIHFVFDPVDMLSRRKPNIYLFALDLKRLNIVKNKEGRVNIKEIFPIKEKSPEADNAPFYFDVIVLSVDEVRYTDYTATNKKIHTYHIGMKNAAFVDLKDENAVIRLVIYKAIENTDIAKLINLTIVPVVSQLGDTVGAAWGTAKLGLKSATEIAALPFRLIFGK